ncbi:hypothetical protein PDIDSM_8932 [Penicillium digitatum]|nr:hypothetical protein PDIDSM_8932 [Penicillium digitatum]
MPPQTPQKPTLAQTPQARQGDLVEVPHVRHEDVDAPAVSLPRTLTGTRQLMLPKLPGAPKTNVTRFATHTEQSFALAICWFYDDYTLYALCWDRSNMSHPIDGQRNGKRPGPSTGGKIDSYLDPAATTDAPFPARPACNGLLGTHPMLPRAAARFRRGQL